MIKREVCERVLRRAASTGADFAELFRENTVNHSVHMIDSKVDAVTDAVVAGAGIRVFKGLRSVTASTVDTSEEGLMRCADAAAAALGEGTAQIDIVLTERLFGDIHPVKIVPSTVPNLRKIEILKEGYFAAKDYDPSITQVSGTVMDADHNILIANSEGLYTQDRQIRTRMYLTAIAEKDGETQTGSCNPGRRMGLEVFGTVIDPRQVGIKAAKQAVVMASAGYCPAGVMPVAPNAWGSINIDDEGTPAQKNVLIEKGVLKGYMIDKMGGRRMNMEPTGSARRESYAYATTSRMTNTYIAAGEDKNEDIIASIEYGLYAKEMGGGSVNPATGEFNFAVSEGYMIRNGKICEPVRGASLVGRGSEVIKKIDMVGNDLELGAGMCGSSSGSVPVNVGQPLIRVSSITVGGR